MWLLRDRQMFRQANVVMAGVKAAVENGRLPRAWFRAVTETDREAEEASFEANSQRMARRTWGP